jgi:hypothetical protein
MDPLAGAACDDARSYAARSMADCPAGWLPGVQEGDFTREMGVKLLNLNEIRKMGRVWLKRL